MIKNQHPESQDKPSNPKQLYRVQLLRKDVEWLDDMKWELRTSRRKLLDRIMQLSFWLIDSTGDDGRPLFNEMEQLMRREQQQEGIKKVA